MAVFSLLGLLLALGAAALIVARPWENASLGPTLTVAPGVGVGLGDSVVVTPARPLHVPNARIGRVGRSAPVTEPVAATRDRGTTPVLGISPGRPVGRSGLVSLPAQPPDVPPAAPPAPAPEPIAPPAPQPVAAPAAVTAPAPQVAGLEGGPSGGGTAAVGDGGVGDCGAILIHEGCEYAFAISFYISPMADDEGEAAIPIVQLVSDASDSRTFALLLGDYPGEEWVSGGRGLWASGEAMGGDRFLAPVAEGLWHQVIVHLEASSRGEGFYEVYLDGQPIDARSGVSLIAPGSSYAQVEVGPGETLESILP